MAQTTWKSSLKCPLLVNFILLALLVVIVCRVSINNGDVLSPENLVFLKQEQIVSKNSEIIPGCNLFSGTWVYDNLSYPHYKDRQCPFMETDFACEKFGRKDLRHQNWRWQPHNCELPRFDGIALLEKLRGKKLLYVGDSMNRNQWRSMLCLINSYLPPSQNKSLIMNGNTHYFHSTEYNATIGFYWAPFLVESNHDHISNHGFGPRTIRLNSIVRNGRHWIDADFLVFDSYVWWMDPEVVTLLWGSFGSPDAMYKDVEMMLRRYEIALNTWSEWLEMHINRTKTKLFFMSISPYDARGKHINVKPASTKCYNKTEPIFDDTYWASGANRSMMEIAESAIEKLNQRGLEVKYLNITQLSSYREDAHVSIYKEFWESDREKIIKHPDEYSDCLHWCLPGLPDNWNEILYTYIMKS